MIRDRSEDDVRPVFGRNLPDQIMLDLWETLWETCFFFGFSPFLHCTANVVLYIKQRFHSYISYRQQMSPLCCWTMFLLSLQKWAFYSSFFSVASYSNQCTVISAYQPIRCCYFKNSSPIHRMKHRYRSQHGTRARIHQASRSHSKELCQKWTQDWKTLVLESQRGFRPKTALH